MKKNPEKPTPFHKQPGAMRCVCLAVAQEACTCYLRILAPDVMREKLKEMIRSGIFEQMVDAIAANPILGPELTFVLVGKIANPEGFKNLAGGEPLAFNKYPAVMRKHHLLLHAIVRALL